MPLRERSTGRVHYVSVKVPLINAALLAELHNAVLYDVGLL